MAVLTAPKYEVEGDLAAKLGLVATRSKYTITESEAVNDVIMLRKLPEGAHLLLVSGWNGGGSIAGNFVIADSQGNVIATLTTGMTGVFQVEYVVGPDQYLAVQVTTAPTAGDGGDVAIFTAFYQFGEP